MARAAPGFPGVVAAGTDEAPISDSVPEKEDVQSLPSLPNAAVPRP